MIKKLLIVGYLLYKVAAVSAAQLSPSESAALAIPLNGPVSERVTTKVYAVEQSKKRRAITMFLKRYNSPLLGVADSFLSACENYDLDCYLLPAIAGLESGFGQAVPAGSYNPFGWGAGRIYFDSWDLAIETVGKGIRENYINQGAGSIEEIGAKYAESPTWASRVRGFMGALVAEEAGSELLFGRQELQL